MILKRTILALALAVTGMLATGCTALRISSFNLEASESPEVYGINHNLEPHKSTLRLHGGIRLDNREDINVIGTYTDLTKDSDTLHKHENFTAEGMYEFGGFEVEGGATWFHKSDAFLYGIGIGFNDGIYHHLTLGINTTHFEAGVFAGLFHQYSRLRYYGETCNDITICEDDDWESTFGDETETRISPFYGLYLGAFLGEMFLEYSLSMYTPNLDIEDDKVNVPMITTNYITLGYRFNEQFEVSGGAIISAIKGKLHYAASLGVNFYPF